MALGGTSLTRTGDQMARLSRWATSRRPTPVAFAVRTGSRRPRRRGLARAALESVAENTSDAHVAPHSGRRRRGSRGPGLPRRKHAGRDDRPPFAALRPIRLGCSAFRRCRELRRRPRDGCPCRCVRTRGRRLTAGGRRAWRGDAARHPSPNAGVVEAAFAGALGVRLGGPTQYAHQLEIRPTLGDGREPEVADLARAVRLSRVVQAAAAVVAVGLSAACRSGRRASVRSLRARLPWHPRVLGGLLPPALLDLGVYEVTQTESGR